jgi:uncharacterized membrane protein YoaK (UPF0700 family)
MDYSHLTLEELLIEEKKIKKKETISAVIIGFLAGVMIYGVVSQGFGFLYIFIPLILIFAVYRNSQKLKKELKKIRSEINAKNTK